MNPLRPVGGWLILLGLLGFLSLDSSLGHAQEAGEDIRVEVTAGLVEMSADGGSTWIRIETNAVLHIGDHLRTGPRSRAAIRLSEATVLPLKALSEVKVLPPESVNSEPGLHIFRGIMSFFHRDKPGRIRIETPGAVAGVDGTEFVISVGSGNGQEQTTTIAVIDGTVRFGNARDTLTLTNDERAMVERSGLPVRTAGFVANNLLQWAFYYPAVLDPAELGFTPAEENELRASLAAYHSGDLLGALAKYGPQQTASEAQQIYGAALLLAVGEVDQTLEVLGRVESGSISESNRRVATALRRQIAAVKQEPSVALVDPKLTTELLAASYYEQSRALGDETLEMALRLARRAATNSPQLGFAWERVAELEFSFGRTERALAALHRSLVLSPRNAQALALQGFLLAAQNNSRAAIGWFERAIALDPALANAWLGRGLCRIRHGDRKAGREDLLIAAALEPRRAQLRNYLGKAYSEVGDSKRALHEFELAQNIDPADPSSWLYSALVKAENNRINDAIRDLEKSQELNDNRSVFRSSLLLDQDRAVRSANLARIYEDAGMTDWSRFEASRAVSYDYANYSAHLFLANSYDQLRDPNRINLRFETPAESEYLIANLIAPVGAGLLAQSVSQQEYSRLFERNRVGVASKTEYLSRRAWTEQGAHFGTFNTSSYLFEALYRSDPGQRHNNDIEERELRLHLKQQLTPRDTLYFRAIDYDLEGGDLVQYYDPDSANRSIRIRERQDPVLAAGYHHEWGPGSHTLFLFGRLPDEFAVDNPLQPAYFVRRFQRTNGIVYAEAMSIDQRYRSRLEIYSAELQQIWQNSAHSFIAGTRYQWGDFKTRNLQTHPSLDVQVFFPPDPSAAQHFATDFDRLSFYGYHHWQVAKQWLLVGGVSYDHIRFPENFRSAPILDREETADQVSPKAGIIWAPAEKTTARLAYTRSLSGASVDQSFQIEPTQIAGFNQSFRSIIPESIGGANAGATFETYNLSLEQRIGNGTYLGLSGEWLNSEVDRTLGNFLAGPALGFARAGSMREKIDFRERTIALSANQLLGDEWSAGARYRLTYADLDDHLPEVVDRALVYDGIRARQELRSMIQQASLYAIYNNRSGFFAKAEAVWTMQHNSGYGFRTPPYPNVPEDPGNFASDIPGDDVWQFNAFIGYRFPRRKAELTVGLLNITDRDYKLNPLTLYNDFARERTLMARLKISF